MFMLLIRHEGREQKRSFSAKGVTIGRRGDNDVQILDKEVSKTHATIEERRKGCLLIDLDSSNGTFVNGQKISKQLLKDGDVIRIGSAEILFRQSGSGDLAAEVESAADEMKRGVGYETMLARIARDQKDRDLAAIRERASCENTSRVEKMFLDLGWSPSEARRLAEESKGKPPSEIDDEGVASVKIPKRTELVLQCPVQLPEIDRGILVRFRGEECLVVDVKPEGDGWSYRLKRT